MIHEIIFTNDEPVAVIVLHETVPYQANPDNPNFLKIVARLANDPKDTSIIDLFDAERAVASRLERLSSRTTVSNGIIFFDGDPIHNSLTEQVVRFLNEGVEDWRPLIFFFEKVMQNPSDNSRQQLLEWLSNDESLTITSDGDIVGYKGCHGSADAPVSTRPAPANEQVTVNDEFVTGTVSNTVGNKVAMPRGFVDPDEATYCSVGLHVGTFRYAQSFASVVVQVHVNPRDVVSVTSDSNREKIRTCAYEVVAVVQNKVAAPVYGVSVYDDENTHDDEEICCGECYDYFDESDLNTEGLCFDCSVALAKDDAEEEVTSTWDTRNNHINQERYPKGHVRAGQFVPKA